MLHCPPTGWANNRIMVLDPSRPGQNRPGSSKTTGGVLGPLDDQTLQRLPEATTTGMPILARGTRTNTRPGKPVRTDHPGKTREAYNNPPTRQYNIVPRRDRSGIQANPWTNELWTRRITQNYTNGVGFIYTKSSSARHRHPRHKTNHTPAVIVSIQV
jgi:hypothetical protein